MANPAANSPPGWPEGAAESFMRLALEEARKGWDLGEIPIGAVVVDREGRPAGRGHNRTITDRDPSAHAEVVAVRQAARAAGNHRLSGHSVFVTVEPCLMCLGLLVQARVDALYYGADDRRVGCVEGVFRRLELEGGLNHRFPIHGGILEEECRELLLRFFGLRRGGTQRPGE